MLQNNCIHVKLLELIKTILLKVPINSVDKNLGSATQALRSFYYVPISNLGSQGVRLG